MSWVPLMGRPESSVDRGTLWPRALYLYCAPFYTSRWCALHNHRSDSFALRRVIISDICPSSQVKKPAAACLGAVVIWWPHRTMHGSSAENGRYEPIPGDSNRLNDDDERRNRRMGERAREQSRFSCFMCRKTQFLHFGASIFRLLGNLRLGS